MPYHALQITCGCGKNYPLDSMKARMWDFLCECGTKLAVRCEVPQALYLQDAVQAESVKDGTTE